MQRFQQTKRALGSEAVLTLVVEDQATADETFAELWEKIQTFEARFSRFLPESELSTFNAAAGAKQPISPEFSDLLLTTKDMAEKTDGLYNPFILPALQRAGYKGSWPTPAEANDKLAYENRHESSWRELKVEGDTAQIPADTALDFGGIGKGYLLDELATWLRAKGTTNFWLSLGGDIICGGFDLGKKPWRVGIQHALKGEETAGEVANETGALLAIATSGVTKRKGETPNGAWHHLIDPRTGAPAQTSVLTATICTPKATDADVLAKCLVIAGTDDAAHLMQIFQADDALVQSEATEGEVAIQKIGNIWSR